MLGTSQCEFEACTVPGLSDFRLQGLVTSALLWMDLDILRSEQVERNG